MSKLAKTVKTGKTGKMVKPEVFGARLDPPRSADQIKVLCREGRIKGAIRPGHEWWLPEDAKVQGMGRRIEYGENAGISVSQYARLHGVSRQRVHKLLKQHRIEGAKKGPHGWDIDPDAPWPAEEF